MIETYGLRLMAYSSPLCYHTFTMSKFIITQTSGSPKTKRDYAAELNEEQFAVVTKGDGPCLVLAGAGSGKTRTIVYRVAYLLEHGVDPHHILLLTFTNKSAREMLSRVELLLGAPPKGLWGGTFHAIAHRILRSYATRAGYRANFSILDEDDSRDLIKATLKDLEIDVKARRFPSPAVLKGVFSYHRNTCVPFDEAMATKFSHLAPIAQDVKKVFEGYTEHKRAANAMDFDDLLIVLLNLLENDQAVAARLQEQFHYILVDEYQDTNPVQARIVKALASRHGNLLVVGDDAQSIYSFRGASVRNILDFPNLFAGAQMFKLETNYRSTPEILNLANDSIEKNEARFSKILRPVRPSFTKPQLVPAASQMQEAGFIAQMVLQLRDEGVKLKDIAVLFRAAHHSQALEFELTKRDIPYEYRGGMKFFERSHIKDALAFLRVVNNPADEVGWMRVLGLQVGIGMVIAGRIIASVAKQATVAEAAALDLADVLPPKARVGWNELREMLREIIGSERPSDLVRAVLETKNYQDYLESEYPNWQERLDDVKQLAVFAEQYTDVTTFLGEVMLFDEYGGARAEGASRDEERIVLSTIHQAKGLEWDTVFVMNLTSEDFPNRRALLEEGGLEEERRLFYVASTRAARQLFLTYPATSGYDTLAIHQPSPFIEELNSHLYEEVEIEERRHDDVTTIEVDDEGNEKPRTHTSFLRDIDEL